MLDDNGKRFSLSKDVVVAASISALASMAGGLVLWASNINSQIAVLQADSRNAGKDFVRHDEADKAIEVRTSTLEHQVTTNTQRLINLESQPRR